MKRNCLENKKKQISIILVLILIFNTFLPNGVKEEIKAKELQYGISNPQIDDSVTTWDCVYFGNYWQNDTNMDGIADKKDEKQPIKWRVLYADRKDAFLLSDKILDCRFYNDTITDMTWENCNLRNWLNNEFLNSAFSAAERDAIIMTNVINNNNPMYDTEGGNNTKDKIYLLSIDEAMNPLYGFEKDYQDTKTRVAKNTEYAKNNGAYAITESDGTSNGWWWLRSPGLYTDEAARVRHYGYIDFSGHYSDDNCISVRPVLHLDLSSSTYTLAGQIDSLGNVNLPVVDTPEPPAVDNNSKYNTSTESVLGYSNLSDWLEELKKVFLIDRFIEFSHTLEGYENESYVIPGIRQTNEDDGSNVCRTMVPQGCCTAGKYFLISAYCAAQAQLKEKSPGEGVLQKDNHKTHNSVIYVMDKNSRKYLCTIVLNGNKSHVGALSYNPDDGIVYIADSKNMCIWELGIGEIKKAVDSGHDAYKVILANNFSIKHSGVAKPSFLCYYADKVFVGVCAESYEDEDKSYMMAYSLKDEKWDNNSKIVLPLKTQGVAFKEHNGETYLIASCSLGRSNTSDIKVYKLKGKNFGSFINNEINTIKYPNMSEDIDLQGNKLNICFESVASIYREGLDQKGYSKNIMDRVPTASFYKVIHNYNIFNAYSLDDNCEEIIDSGECGDNLTYILYKNGCMDISGQGDMYDYEYGSQPWNEYKYKITSVSVDADVDSIGTYAFNGCTNIKTVSLSEAMPESNLFSIGAYAFAGCSGINAVSLPESEYFIDDTAFTDCSEDLKIKSDCNYLKEYCEQNSILLHEHTYVFKEKIKPTCGCAGYDEYLCECGKNDVRNVVDSNNNHNFELITDIASTYEEKGVKGYQCTECGTYYEEEIDVLAKTDAAPTPTQIKEPTETPTEKPEQKPDASQGQPTETPVPSSTGIGNTPPDINNANVPSAGNVDTAVQSPAAAKILSAKNTKKGKVVIKLNKLADVNGYEIQYSNNKKFKKAKKKSTSKNKYTIKKLKKKKVYYIRLRAYKVVNGVKIYGSWSKPKKIKIKK